MSDLNWKDVGVGDWVRVRLDCDLDGRPTECQSNRVIVEGTMRRDEKYHFAYLETEKGKDLVLYTTDTLLAHRKAE